MAKATLSISRRVYANGQTQITVQGIKHPERGTQISRKTPVLLTTGKGNTLVMADTHAIWLQHQKTEEQRIAWQTLATAIEAKGVCTLDFDVEPTTLGTAQVAPVSLDDIL